MWSELNEEEKGASSAAKEGEAFSLVAQSSCLAGTGVEGALASPSCRISLTGARGFALPQLPRMAGPMLCQSTCSDPSQSLSRQPLAYEMQPPFQAELRFAAFSGPALATVTCNILALPLIEASTPVAASALSAH